MIPEQSTRLTVVKIRKEEMIAAMRRLLNSPDFMLLRRRWLSVRGEILENGKEKPTAEQWAVLRGFDAAIMESEKWAGIETREDDHKRQAADLQEQLSGGQEK